MFSFSIGLGNTSHVDVETVTILGMNTNVGVRVLGKEDQGDVDRDLSLLARRPVPSITFDNDYSRFDLDPD